jgi:hypothetical protein
MIQAPVIKTDDDWQAEAAANAVAAARRVVSGKEINGLARVSSLSEIELGWIGYAFLFGWIETKAKQAVAEGQGYDATIRTMHDRDPAPWESGAVASTLPAVGGFDLPWAKPVSEWSQEQMIQLLWKGHRLTAAALVARDEGATDKLTRPSRERVEREHSAANGGPLMTPEELDEEVPF